jgi:hypothetical protein
MIPKSGYRFSDKIMLKGDIKIEGLKPGTTVPPTAYAYIAVAAFLIACWESSRYKVAGTRGHLVWWI